MKRKNYYLSYQQTTKFDDGNPAPDFGQAQKCIYIYMDVVEWSRALDVRLSEWCCSVSMVWVQIPSREEQKFDSSKI
jgi:hypothetical protein